METVGRERLRKRIRKGRAWFRQLIRDVVISQNPAEAWRLLLSKTWSPTEQLVTHMIRLFLERECVVLCVAVPFLFLMKDRNSTNKCNHKIDGNLRCCAKESFLGRQTLIM